MDRVLMFSTGMDSFIMKSLHNFSDDKCLFVNMGTVEAEQEKKHIIKYFPDAKQVDLKLHQWELPNKIIPFRNHILAMVGANYANNVFMAFTAGDTSRDKDYVFKAQMDGVLNYFGSDSDLERMPESVRGSHFEVHIPFKKYTKTELVGMYLEKTKGDHLPLLEQSRSCYEGGSKPCGICKPCIRKYISLTLNNVDPDELAKWFIVDPKSVLKVFSESIKSRDRKQEGEEVRRCIDLVGGVL